MSFLQDIARTAKTYFAQSQANQFLKPYGVKLTELVVHPAGRFEASLELEGELEELHLVGQLSFDLRNRATVVSLLTGRAWLNHAIRRHVLGRELPLTEAQSSALRSLFPS
jgi:hypothetical protein